MGAVLDVEQREAMARYFRNGGGYVGVHSASACLYEDEVYDKVVGGTCPYSLVHVDVILTGSSTFRLSPKASRSCQSDPLLHIAFKRELEAYS